MPDENPIHADPVTPVLPANGPTEQPLDHNRRHLEVAAVRGKQGVRLGFLLDEAQKFVLLGEGRTAKVYLGVIVADGRENQVSTQDQEAIYVAIKCLLTDENIEYRQQIHARFKVEMNETSARGGDSQETFVKFKCQGRVTLEGLSPEEQGEKLTKLLRDTARDLEVKPWPAEVLKNALSLKGEKLEGSFYAMQLCQGSLLDVLESSNPWDELSCYQALDWAKQNLQAMQERAAADVKDIVEKHFEQDQPENWSGYEILNAFQDTNIANALRGRIVLEQALAIARLIKSLHTKTQEKSYSLAHRDLKPGNILVHHPLQIPDMLEPVFRLSDLGYVVERRNLEKGAESIRLDNWRTHQVPGSQFYRAPEQWTLPIEVRMKADRGGQSGTVFKVLSSRLDSVEQGDYLVLPRKYLKLDDELPKTIVQVTRVGGETVGPSPRRRPRQLQLRIEEEITAGVHHDIVAHIVKASGFHTDGFSFGAMLYDLATGGKNPEHFYFYCLHRYQVDWDVSSNLTVEGIVDELLKLKEVENMPDVVRTDETAEFAKATSTAKGEDVEKIVKGKRGGFFKKFWPSREAVERIQLGDHPVVATPLKKLPSKERTYAEYLRDERGVEIPPAILLLICKCMLRGYKGCYYRSNVSNGWTADDNVKAFDKIVEDIRNVRNPRDGGGEGSKAMSSQFSWPADFPGDFMQNTLVLLRCLGKGRGNPAALAPAAPNEVPEQQPARLPTAIGEDADQ